MQQVPVLETPDGPLTESSAIARYLASLSTRQALYPQSDDPSDTMRALIDAWIDWATVLDKATKDWVEPMFGEGSQQQAAVDAAKADFERALQTLNMHLGPRTYLVGDTMTLADLVVVSHLLLLYLTVRISHTIQIKRRPGRAPPAPPPPPPPPPPARRAVNHIAITRNIAAFISRSVRPSLLLLLGRAMSNQITKLDNPKHFSIIDARYCSHLLGQSRSGTVEGPPPFALLAAWFRASLYHLMPSM